MSPERAAAELLAVQLDYAQRGLGLAHAALAGARRFVEWSPYPQDGCVDRRHGAYFFYHAHDAASRPANEHGHFHVFAPGRDAAVHLVGLSIDAFGQPTRLFTTNQWVTDGPWRDAAAMRPLLQGFSLRTAGRLAPLARWVQAAVHLWSPLIDELLVERDRTLADYARQHGLTEPAARQRRALHVLSQRPVSLLERLDELSPPSAHPHPAP